TAALFTAANSSAALGCFERCHEGRDRRDYAEQLSRLRPRKACRDDLVEEGAQRSPVAADIDEQDRLVVEPELFPAEDFEHFVEGSDTAGQNSKRVRFLRHQMLALVH